MVAVSEMSYSAPVAAPVTGSPPGFLHRRRAVAVTVTPMELLRPESDLARLVEAFEHVDVLVVGDDEPVACVVDVLNTYGDTYTDSRHEVLRGEVARLGHPDLHLHRLGLRPPVGPGAEHDLVAAMSELVGFDPEPGVYCLAPAPAPADPGRTAVTRAAQRIAQVYGIPLQRYRCLELSVVGDVTP
ncbi:MAG: hypothetical protein QOI36_2944 [Pseudonocardiales bacterium]|jgi:hypothetical protein|nr:hypothetical protein [Pseudonocardia sp.]MDT7651538.1 hypothetical protein [Pseudonocardiales bacterium]